MLSIPLSIFFLLLVSCDFRKEPISVNPISPPLIPHEFLIATPQKDLEREKLDFATRHVQLTEQIDRLQYDLEEARKSFELDLHAAHARARTLEQEQRELKLLLDVEKAETHRLASLSKTHEDEKNRLSAEYTTRIGELEAELSHSRSESENLMNTIAQLRAAAEQKTAANSEALTTKISELESEKQKLLFELSSLRQRVQYLEMEKSSIEARYRAENGSLSKQNADLQNAVSLLSAKVKKLKSGHGHSHEKGDQDTASGHGHSHETPGTPTTPIKLTHSHPSPATPSASSHTNPNSLSYPMSPSSSTSTAVSSERVAMMERDIERLRKENEQLRAMASANAVERYRTTGTTFSLLFLSLPPLPDFNE